MPSFSCKATKKELCRIKKTTFCFPSREGVNAKLDRFVSKINEDDQKPNPHKGKFDLEMFKSKASLRDLGGK
ncbi:hypothetical protein TanjilG_30067 [Lupinus angustifolius]|uniref:Uncharacterized protein n=1 Tax=Lupinus angustifolius TaxID=3871 RepID=A0A4P1R6G0_LUPAN|nr:hypothetical protein TanjilG_30067 [Lupinus angustifolius]